MNTMQMGTGEVFYYVVPGENFYYYAAVNVIPATSIYFEDNCGMVTYHKGDDLAEWGEVGSTSTGTQAQDRPGASSILEGLDANNIYGYDGSYASTATYSNGSAYKVTVNQHKAQDKVSVNGVCDYKDKNGKFCYKNLTHSFQDNGAGKCNICLNAEDQHGDNKHSGCTDGNYNEYCDVCSKWMGTHTTKARASFTFTGTGFDIVSLCSNNTGLVLVNVFRGEVTDFSDPKIYNEDTYVESYFVDTYYGYKYEDDEWVVDPNADSTFYQVPVIKSDLTNVVWSPDDPSTPEDETVYKNFGYDTYTVELVVGASWTPGTPNYDNAEFYLDPIVTPKRPALSFNGMVCYNVFFTAEELGNLTAADLGLAVFDSYDPEGTVETARDVVMGATLIDGQYMVATNGIHAKYLGDTQYFRVFAKKADGTYVYSKMVSYSAVDYAKNALANSDDVKLKQLVVAMLNYGADDHCGSHRWHHGRPGPACRH